MGSLYYFQSAYEARKVLAMFTTGEDLFLKQVTKSDSNGEEVARTSLEKFLVGLSLPYLRK